MAETVAYKILTADEAAALARGGWRGSALDLADGFIHLSTAGQLTETVDRYFADSSGLVVAAIDLTALGDALRWEPSRGGQLFPHVYGSLDPGVVIAQAPLARGQDGQVILPV